MDFLWKLALQLSLLDCLAGKPPERPFYILYDITHELLFIDWL